MRRRLRNRRNAAATLALACALGLTLSARSASARIAFEPVVADMDGDGGPGIANTELAPARWKLLQGGQHDWLENASKRR